MPNLTICAQCRPHNLREHFLPVPSLLFSYAQHSSQKCNVVSQTQLQAPQCYCSPTYPAKPDWHKGSYQLYQECVCPKASFPSSHGSSAPSCAELLPLSYAPPPVPCYKEQK